MALRSFLIFQDFKNYYLWVSAMHTTSCVFYFLKPKDVFIEKRACLHAWGHSLVLQGTTEEESVVQYSALDDSQCSCVALQ